MCNRGANLKEVGTRTRATASVPRSKAARAALVETLTERCADMQLADAPERGAARKGSPKGEGKGKRELSVEEKQKKDFFRDLGAKLRLHL